MSFLIARIKNFDAYSKPLDDFRVKTWFGGTVTLISGMFMLMLFVGEFHDYLKTEIVQELFVDSSRGEDRVKINFDIVFVQVPCEFLSVDIMDVSGGQQSNVDHNVWKERLDLDGKPVVGLKPQKLEVGEASSTVNTDLETTTKSACGSCYGAETKEKKCCTTCDDVKEQYRRKGWAMIEMDRVEQCRNEGWAGKMVKFKDEGCRVYGSAEVAKVAGNFHIAPGKSLTDRHAHVHDLHSMSPQRFNTGHKVNHLSFGLDYPGKPYPIDGMINTENAGGVMFQYFVKIVPTVFKYIEDKTELSTHQFSVTKHQRQISPHGMDGGLPGFFIMYEFSPVMIKLTEQQRSISFFLTSVCAIIGGVFTVASLFDSCIYHSSKAFQQKMEIGKAS